MGVDEGGEEDAALAVEPLGIRIERACGRRHVAHGDDVAVRDGHGLGARPGGVLREDAGVVEEACVHEITSDRPEVRGGRYSCNSMRGSVGGGEDFRLHQLHGGTAAFHAAVARLDAEHLRAALLALKSLAQLVCHAAILRRYFFCSMGWLQQEISPSPPLVTIISVLHLLHW